MAESLIEILPAAYTDISLYLSQYAAITTATADLIEAISHGALITNYLGHGGVDTWSSRWFQTPNLKLRQTQDDVSLLTNTDQYTFLIILNCLSGAFSEVNDDYCMAEEFVRQQNKGAVFCVAPSSSGFLSEQEVLGKKIYDYLFNENITIGGALLTASKIAAYQQKNSRDLLETFIFFGDPALELKVVPECVDAGDCGDGLYCNGQENCVGGECFSGTEPCEAGELCDEEADQCVELVECEEDGDCDVGVCSDEKVCVECMENNDCIGGVCSGNLCVECADDNDCDRGICISNVCVVKGSVQIDKCKIKAGKNGKGDKIKFSGLLDVTEADFNAEIGGDVVVTIESDDIPDLDKTTYTFLIEEDTLKKGKYKSTKVKPVDKGDPVTSIKIDTKKGKMKFSAKDVDLSGLGCPITVTIQIGDYVAGIVLYEDIVNGPKKPCPPELIVGM